MSTSDLDEARVRELVAFVDARRTGADQRVLTLLDWCFGDAIPDLRGLDLAVQRAILGFKYNIDEPGTDSLDYWSESHGLAFAAAAYLAGHRFAERTFPSPACRGAQLAERAEARLRRWLSRRFRRGLTQWLSPQPYVEALAALTLLVQFAPDPDIATRAAMVADMVVLDLAMHHFEGSFAATQGVCAQAGTPANRAAERLLDLFFGEPPVDLDPDSPLAIVARSTAYRPPPVLREIALGDRPRLIRQNTGFDFDEIEAEAGDPASATLLAWELGGFCRPETVGISLRGFRSWKLQHNRQLESIQRLAGFGGGHVLPGTIRMLNPLSQGRALTSVDLVTFRTRHYLLSSSQRYRPGEFGHRQRPWQAALPGGINVFSNHPGAVDRAACTDWTRCGVLPDVVQHEHVVLALYDLRTRPGFGGPPRDLATRLYFPFVRFDETRLGYTWVAGQARGTFIGIVSLAPLEMISRDQLVQRGAVTGYGVVLGDRSQFTSLGDFSSQLKLAGLRLRGGSLVLTHGGSTYQLDHRRGLLVDGEARQGTGLRYDTPWVRAAKDARVVSIEAGGRHLRLDWTAGTREF